ncbi:MAG TPA: hypothetical protein VII97_06120 [Anaerolineales bacterium]
MSQQPINSEITSDDKLWALLSWLIWPIAIVVLLMDDKKTRPFIKYNAVNSLALSVIAWGSSIIGIGLCLGPLAFIYSVVLGIQSYQGKLVTVPVLTDFVKKQSWVA